MNSSVKKESIIHFDGISNSRWKNHKISIEIFLNELFVRFPNQEDYIIVYSFDSLEQLKMEKQYKDDQCDYINISISYPENRSKFESIVVESEDARKIIQKCKCYQMKIQELDS